jgi:uncharacterized protein YdhG (YjbR/CyaY superfamily)
MKKASSGTSRVTKPHTVASYIAGFPKEVRPVLRSVRATIQKAAPGAEETISYGIPSYKLHGVYVAHFGGFAKHIGLYPPAPKSFHKETAKYAGPKGNLKLPLSEPVPLELIRRIVHYRVKQVVAK